MIIQNLTLSALKTAKTKNGTTLASVQSENNLNELVAFAKGKIKANLPVLYCYQGIKGEYTPSNCCFIDIDTTAGVDTVLDNAQLVFRNIPYIAFLQKSASGKLHICCRFANKAVDASDFKYQTVLHTIAVGEKIKRLLDIDYFTLTDDKGKPALDTHNTKFEQALYISSNSIIYNEYCTPVTFSQEIIAQLKSEHKEYFTTQEDATTHYVTITSNEYKFGSATGKTLIDANFTVGPYSGNDLRWRISRIAEALFGAYAKEWCDKYFYRKEGSIYTKQKEHSINTIVLNWLEKNHYIETNVAPSSVLIKKGEWLSDYSEQIFNFIDKNRVSYIVAPTGVGKTTFINDTLAQRYNAVVIVPFNVTNQLYNKLVEVSSSTDNGVSDKPLVMIWDQFLKYKEQLKDRTVIIDEAHCLFKDRSYRDSAVRLFKFLLSVEFTGKIVLVSATPEGEANVLKANELRFEAERTLIPTYWIATYNPLLKEYYCIVNALKYNKYDRIVLFDNRYSKKIRERLIVEGIIAKEDIAYLKADRKDTDDFNNVRNTEILDKKVIICTCVAFNGLNFKNENEKILVVTSIKNGEDTYSELVQELGRIRKSKVVGYIYYDPELTNSVSVEVKAQIAKELSELAEKENFDDRLLSYCRDLADIDTASARIEIEKYNYLNANVDAIIEGLSKYTYIKLKMRNLEDEKNQGFRLAIKKQESDEMAQDIKDGVFEMTEYNGEYNTEWSKELKYLLEQNEWLNLDVIKKMLKSKNKNKLIETVIGNVEEIIRICKLTDEQWNSYLDADSQIVDIIKQNVVMLKDYVSHRKHQIEIRRKWEPIVKANGCKPELYFPEIFEQLISEQESIQGELITLNAKGGKATKQIKIGDVVYNSVQEAADINNTNRKTIQRWLKSGKAIEL